MREPAGERPADAAAPGPPALATPAGGDPATYVDQLRDTLEDFDEVGAHAVFDRALGAFTVDALLGDVVLPYLRGLGERWATGVATVAQEHYASNVLQGRLLGLARGWDQGGGPLALLACPSGERHQLGLVCFGLALRARGWRIAYLGAETPADSIVGAVARLDPRLVVLAALRPEPLLTLEGLLDGIHGRTRLVIAGGGATADVAARLRADRTTADPVGAAEGLSRSLAT
jgi:methanogenic corrinoid protein MtbC1